jgi:hypothetical protein
MSQNITTGDNQGYVPQIDEKPIDNQFNVVNNPNQNDFNNSNNIPQQYPVDIKSSQNTEDDQIIKDQIRNGFIRKVFGIVTIQLIFSFSFILFCQTKSIKNFIARNEGFCVILFSISTIAFIISVCLVYCNRELARKVPSNYILLFCVTFAESMLSTAASIKYPVEIVRGRGMDEIPDTEPSIEKEKRKSQNNLCSDALCFAKKFFRDAYHAEKYLQKRKKHREDVGNPQARAPDIYTRRYAVG